MSISSPNIDQHDERPIINITGERVALGPMRHVLVPLYQKWINMDCLASEFESPVLARLLP